ncbi:unnamed protein product [Urochloa humidicola]
MLEGAGALTDDVADARTHTDGRVLLHDLPVIDASMQDSLDSVIPDGDIKLAASGGVQANSEPSVGDAAGNITVEAAPPVKALAFQFGGVQKTLPKTQLNTSSMSDQQQGTGKMKARASKTAKDTMAPGTSSLRRSLRSTMKNDEHKMKKTEHRAAIRNLEATGNSSFQSFSDSRISSNMSNIGVSLGRDVNLARSSSIAIKNIEVDRLSVTAKKKLERKNNIKTNISKVITNFSDEEEERLDTILSHVSGDLNEDVHEQGYDHILSDLSAVSRKKKSNSAKKINNGKSPRKQKTPSKLRLQ